MSMTRQTLLASRPAAMVLALSLVAAMTAPVLLLPRAFALPAATPTVGCTADGHSINGGANASSVGCTELSPTPPQDTVAVPPNIMLMLDDSGSMNWDYMPDACYLYGVTCTGTYNGTNPVNGNGVDYVQSAVNAALIDSANNGVYYSPTQAYLPPPGPTGTLNTSYSDITNVPIDGFGTTTTNTANLTRYSNPDVSGEAEACGIPGNGNCGTSLIYSASQNVTTTGPATFDETVQYTSQWHRGRRGNPGYYTYTYADQVCLDDFNGQSGATNYSFTGLTQDSNGNWLTGTCQYTYTATTTTTYRYFQYSTGPANGPYTIHYIAPASQGCGNLSATTTPTCILDTDTSGVAAPVGVTVGTNIANWFAYDHTRILMAKTGLMSAFSNLNANYRFGFGSIDGNNDGALPNQISSNGFNVAPVAVFGDGTSGTQRANFWTWITGETASGGTPLQRALQAVGMYYQTAQPWTTMSSDPGYSATGTSSPFACRASYAIMTTDGFWNGSSPGVGNADNTSTGPFTVPTGDMTGYTPAAPFKDSYSNTLADVAMYYWANDLRTGLANEVAPSKQDPASWQHMTTFTMGLGFTPTGIQGTDAAGNAVTIPEIFDWAQGGAAITGFSWPQPASNSIYNIADLAHAAVNGHGDFFSIKSPQDLAAGFSKALADINARVVPPTPSSVNASVLTAGALTFETGYNTGDWSGSFKVVELNADGSAGASVWPKDPDTLLDADYHVTGNPNRTVFSYEYNPTGSPSAVGATTFAYQTSAATIPSWLDPTELSDLENIPALTGGNDTVANRINYLLGDNTYEGTAFRSRTSILGAIINAAPVYVSGAQSNYNGNWPANSPELPPSTPPSTGGGVALQTYDEFVGQQSTPDAAGYKPGMVYIAANDGMLHAFDAPPPKCNAPNPCTYASDSGSEAWAFIPRAVYANLGNLTSPSMNYRPTVDESPVSRDVFFGESSASNTDNYWHTILTGGVGLGGRGVYALDITNPNASSPETRSDGSTIAKFGAGNVLWEFDSDMTVSSTCVAIQSASSTATISGSATGTCSASDLGYTISQPNVARLSDGTWAVLVPNGYFPDCSTPDAPSPPGLPPTNPNSCAAIAAQAPQYNKGTATQTPYSALFVLDAQTGKVLAELKTPQGVPSFGLATPVLGDLTNNNVDNVAYAGDAEGNLWKFNLGATTCAVPAATTCGPTTWTVSLVYQAQTPGAQPITTMPRIFPDPVSNGFMVVFGTGKFLGVGDNSNNTVQAVYGVRDPDPASDGQTPVSLANATGAQSLTQNYLHEETIPTTIPNPSGSGTVANPAADAGETLRCLTGGASDTCDTSKGATNPPTAINNSSQTGGWYFNLDVQVSGAQADAGERVVVSPGAIFASNTIVVESLITGAASSDACSPTTTGAIMAINAATGAPAGVSSLGGWPMMGGRINNARTSGNLPIVSALGGGQAYLPGTGLAPSGKTPFSVDAPIWRRRSWSEVNQGQ